MIPSEQILKTKVPAFPQFLFEWHPRMQGKVYVIELPGKWIEGKFFPSDSLRAEGVCIAEHCEHHARFFGFVQTYLRGYKKAIADRNKCYDRKES